MNYIKLAQAAEGPRGAVVGVQCGGPCGLRERAREYSLVEDLGSFVAREVLQLQ